MGQRRIDGRGNRGRPEEIAVAVYVDGLRDYGWHRGPSCHLIADSVEELIEFAEAMGLRRECFQAKSTPHFDLTVDARRIAVSMGAEELTNRQLIANIRELRHRKRLQDAVLNDLQKK